VRPTAVLIAEFLLLSSFVIVMFQGRLLACLCVLHPDNPAANACVCSDFSLCSNYTSCWPPEVT